MTAQVTKLQPTKRDPSRVTIRAGGKAVATLRREVVTQLHIDIGTTWTQAIAQRAQQAAEVDKAERYALSALARRALSRGQMIERLHRRGYATPVVEDVVQRLAQRRLLDDMAYGRALISAQRARKHAGKHLLAHKLARAKLARSTIDKLLADCDTDYDAVAEARRLAQQRMRSAAFGKLGPQVRRRRLWGLLARRGFDVDDIHTALARLPGLADAAD